MSYESFAQVYDRLTFNVDYESYARFITDRFAEHGIRNGLILDAACGTGSLGAILQSNGFDMILADASRDMLMVASAKVPGALLLCQDMTGLDLYGTVRASVCTLDSVNHLPGIDAVDAFFAKVSLFTEPGGVFVFDVNTPYKHRTTLGNNTFIYDLPDVYCVWQNAYDDSASAVSISLDMFISEGGVYRRRHDSFREYDYEIADLKRALEKNGFSQIRVYSDTDATPYRDEPDCQRLYFCAVKI